MTDFTANAPLALAAWAMNVAYRTLSICCPFGPYLFVPAKVRALLCSKMDALSSHYSPEDLAGVARSQQDQQCRWKDSNNYSKQSGRVHKIDASHLPQPENVNPRKPKKKKERLCSLDGLWGPRAEEALEQGDGRKGNWWFTQDKRW